MRGRRRGARGGGNGFLRAILTDPAIMQVVLIGGGILVAYSYFTGQLEEFVYNLRDRLLAIVPYALLGLAAVLAVVAVVLFARGRSRETDLVLGTTRLGRFRVRPDERRAHLTVLGLSGTGKSKGVASWVAQDIRREGEVPIVLDIHQTLIDDILGLVGDTVAARGGLVLEAGHQRWAYGFDPLWCFEGDRPEARAAAAARAWQTIYGTRWSDRIEYYIRSSFQAVIEGGWTILEAPRLLDDPDFRAYVRERCTSDAMRDFFRTFESKRQGRQAEEIASVQVRLQEFTADPLLRAMLGPAVRDEQYLAHRRAALPGYEPRVINLAALVEDGRPILADLAYRELGESSKLLAGMTLAVLLDLFLRRDAALAGSGLRGANVWADELQHYATDSVTTIYTQARKFGLSFCAVCTGLGQLSPQLRATLLGAGLLVSFQTLARDAAELAPEMFWREFERVKAGGGRGDAGNPVYYAEREVLAEQVDWLNKAGARTFWAYSRRRREDAVLLRTLDVAPTLGAAERAAVRDASGARYGNDLALVREELRLRAEWLEGRRYRLAPRTRQEGSARGRVGAGESPHADRGGRSTPARRGMGDGTAGTRDGRGGSPASAGRGTSKAAPDSRGQREDRSTPARREAGDAPRVPRDGRADRIPRAIPEEEPTPSATPNEGRVWRSSVGWRPPAPQPPASSPPATPPPAATPEERVWRSSVGWRPPAPKPPMSTPAPPIPPPPQTPLDEDDDPFA